MHSFLIQICFFLLHISKYMSHSSIKWCGYHIHSKLANINDSMGILFCICKLLSSSKMAIAAMYGTSLSFLNNLH